MSSWKMAARMSVHSFQLRWGVEQRLEFIEFRLFWEGAINRSDLVDQFGVSVPQASNDLRRYQEIAPCNMVYDKSAKRYNQRRRTLSPFFPNRMLGSILPSFGIGQAMARLPGKAGCPFGPPRILCRCRSVA